MFDRISLSGDEIKKKKLNKETSSSSPAIIKETQLTPNNLPSKKENSVSDVLSSFLGSEETETLPEVLNSLKLDNKRTDRNNGITTTNMSSQGNTESINNPTHETASSVTPETASNTIAASTGGEITSNDNKGTPNSDGNKKAAPKKKKKKNVVKKKPLQPKKK